MGVFVVFFFLGGVCGFVILRQDFIDIFASEKQYHITREKGMILSTIMS